jgi:hypothetical protein
LQIALLNLMPEKIKTETQLLRVLGATPLQIEMTLQRPGSHESKNTPQEHLTAFYKTWEEVRHGHLTSVRHVSTEAVPSAFGLDPAGVSPSPPARYPADWCRTASIPRRVRCPLAAYAVGQRPAAVLGWPASAISRAQRRRTHRRGMAKRITTKDFAVFDGDSHVVEPPQLWGEISRAGVPHARTLGTVRGALSSTTLRVNASPSAASSSRAARLTWSRQPRGRRDI